MRPRVDPALVARALVRSGPARAEELCRQLGISQPTLSRLVRRVADQVLVVGRARATRYASRRTIDGVATPIPVYEVRPRGERPRHLLDLHPVHPDGFHVEPRDGSVGAFTDDLPWFLADHRPSGFLGRLLPRQFPALGAPLDVSLWTGDDVLRFTSRHGWNLTGALIVGEEAFCTWVERATDPPDRVPSEARADRYPELAADVLAFGPAGSSAGGEQPKFLATRDDGGALVPVLVKFSPPLRDEAATRTADLLVAEHLVHEVLAECGVPAARSAVVRGGERVFLEVERFDRDGPEHRRGLVSLAAVDAEWVGGPLDRWSSTTAALARQALLGEDDHRRVRWLEVFGAWIADTDMHAGNLSFWLDGIRLHGVAPAYDLQPAAYAVRHGEILPVRFHPVLPSPSDADLAYGAWAAAMALWERIAAHPEVSPGFRQIARDNAAAVGALASQLDRLPS